jgi:hypothetical protein
VTRVEELCERVVKLTSGSTLKHCQAEARTLISRSVRSPFLVAALAALLALEPVLELPLPEDIVLDVKIGGSDLVFGLVDG